MEHSIVCSSFFLFWGFMFNLIRVALGAYANKIIPMRPKRIQTEASSKRHNNNPHVQREQQTVLRLEILRLQALEKLELTRDVFQKNQQDLCQYFMRYKPHRMSGINVKSIINSEPRLIKNTNKVYFGETLNEQRHGSAILIQKQGRIYEGQFQANVREGLGMEIAQNGNVYIGGFVNNKKHGNGQYYWFNLSPPNKAGAEYVEYYDGHWWGGLPDGKGSYQKANGDIYDGNFKNGLKHGEGEEYFANGDSYRGNFINGFPEGVGKYYWLDGSEYEGDFKQGLRFGKGIWVSKLKKEKYVGSYVLDKKSGFGQFTWSNGRFLFRGHFENDQRHGFGELFMGGKLQYRGEWINGERAEPSKSQRSEGKKGKQPTSMPKDRTKIFASVDKLKAPSDAILHRIENCEIGTGSSSFVRSKSPSAKLCLLHKSCNVRKKSPSQYFQTSSDEKEQTVKRRPASYNRSIDTRLGTMKNSCSRKNCGCNPRPLTGEEPQFRKKRRSLHIRTEGRIGDNSVFC